MKRLVPVRSSRDITHYDSNGHPDGIVVRIEYESKEVSDAEYEQALQALEEIFPAPWKK